jgi:hypothetical protein
LVVGNPLSTFKYLCIHILICGIWLSIRRKPYMAQDQGEVVRRTWVKGTMAIPFFFSSIVQFERSLNKCGWSKCRLPGTDLQ